MREQIDTIPVNEAFESGDECPFCYMERMVEQKAIRYTLGPAASYMEPDVRGVTDRQGFCREHFQKMYTYGNALGNALIMQTYYAGLLEELEQETANFVLPEKRPLLGKRKDKGELPIVAWAKQRQGSCFICNKLRYNMDRYYTTFFAMIKDEEFRQKVALCKGFCMRHFIELLENAGDKLPNSQLQWFYETTLKLMKENMFRVKEDIDWFVGMFDYRQAGKDWKNSRDAVSRGMEKLQGLHPADPPYKMDL